ncbi:MAG: fibrobacter succinogenes major paralogous domain-containing protein [Fibrobacter sp.]|nr:fibrobacter succinogenes major paralogous domain-containing protein [Fibrobacter sp.]
MRDSRDGKTYKTVKIGNQEWMAENLNYNAQGSVCYDNDPANCRKYGRLYTWDAAQDACLAGWHLPSAGEFETLLGFVGDSGKEQNEALRSSKWKKGKDKYGFSALPAGGYGSGYEKFSGLGLGAYFWSSAEHISGVAYSLDISDGGAYVGSYDKSDGNSVRCLKDSN